MSSFGYYVHAVEALHWLTMAQKAVVTKNKVRKELWAELMEIIHWDMLLPGERAEYLRIPQASFVALQTFCLTDGKGADTVSNDQLLNFCTTIADLRSRLPESALVRTQVRSESHVSNDVHIGDESPQQESSVRVVQSVVERPLTTSVGVIAEEEEKLDVGREQHALP